MSWNPTFSRKMIAAESGVNRISFMDFEPHASNSAGALPSAICHQTLIGSTVLTLLTVCRPAGRPDEKATLVPSGVHEGCPFHPRSPAVSETSEPDASVNTSMSVRGYCPIATAILLPSGENLGP